MSADLPRLRGWLDGLLERRSLGVDDARALLVALTDAELPPALAGALLAAVRAKGATADELRGFALGMRSLARRPAIAAGAIAGAVDIVGTGGDKSGSFNLSTGASLLAAASGLTVIKHGNRSVSSKAGSADVLEALGLPLPLDEQRAAACLAATGFTFLFAPHYHPAMKAIGPVRNALGVRTVFNILGPLTNPAEPPFHVIGAYDEPTARLMAEALAGLPLKRAFVIHGAAGWDEPSPLGPFLLLDVRPGEVFESRRTPADYGIAVCREEHLQGGDAACNAAALTRVLRGEDHGPHRDALLLGAALALEVTGRAPGPRDAIVLARTTIDDGRASAQLAKLAAFSRSGGAG
ncbi:MAG TPA: anthranilate phosphoribosyltransferase [Steroidobacteraceae bacterium]|nr:anthranilate phosphoribosyltransferase [Steroidobacteraceae bacterium]